MVSWWPCLIASRHFNPSPPSNPSSSPDSFFVVASAREIYLFLFPSLLIKVMLKIFFFFLMTLVNPAVFLYPLCLFVLFPVF
jgi:hypothetical protein